MSFASREKERDVTPKASETPESKSSTSADVEPIDKILREHGDTPSNVIGYESPRMGEPFTLSPQEEKKLLRRIDWHLLPLMAIIYMMKTLDASNVRLLSIYTNSVVLTP
jgi:hypothetical protein